jgi:peptide/nickel transport system substrate-binding protein
MSKGTRRGGRPRQVLVAACAIGLLATACTTGGKLTGPGSTGAGLTTVPAQLTIGSPQKILTLDPALAADGYSEGVLREIGANLYELGGGGRIFPLLVKSARVSANGLTWTFKLRPGLVFSNGWSLTSADVRATFYRERADKSNVYAGFFTPIASIATPRPTMVVFRLTRPYPSLPTLLSQPEMTILPARGLAEGSRFFNAPVSAGPYKLVSWGGGPTAVLVRNADYAGPKPLVQRLIYTYVPDSSTRLAEVQSGQLDLAMLIPSRLLSGVRAPLVAGMTAHFGFVSLDTNTTKPPLNELGVRKAISDVIDRRQIVATAFNGQTTPIAGFWPSTMSGYNKNIQVTPNLAAARAALRGTSCAHGCTIQLLYSSADPWSSATAAVIAQNLAAIGITVQQNEADDATVNQDLLSEKYQMGLGFLFDYNNIPDGMLTYAMNINGGLDDNFSGWRPPASVSKVVTQAITQGGGARRAALSEINHLFRQYQPFVTICTYSAGFVSRYASSVVTIGSSGFVDVGTGR